MEVIEENSGRNFYLPQSESLDESTEDEHHRIHGVALGHRDMTRSKNGSVLYWSSDALEMAAQSLEERPLVVDHEESSYSVVGEVERATFEEGVGIVYEARLTDDDLAEKIQDDLLEVSVSVYRPDDEKLEEREDGTLNVDRAKIDNLSIVPKGEAPSNFVEYGESESFSEEEVEGLLDSEDSTEEFDDGTEEEFDDSGDTDSVEVELEDVAEVVADNWDASEEEVLSFFESVDSLEEVQEFLEESEPEEETGEGVEEGEHSLLDEVVLS